MISVDQIRQLETKVRHAIEVIHTLREENDLLKTKLSGYESRIEELEVLIDSFKQDQTNIEKGIINALQQLDVLEDIVTSGDGTDQLSDSAALDESDSTEENSEKTQEADSEELPAETVPESNTETLENELDIF